MGHNFKTKQPKSVILAPFNSTRSHISDNYMEKEGITPLIAPQNALQFADKCREVNRQYMLNNNAELDNGVYNENEEEEKKEEDGLVGLNNPIEHKVNIPLSVSPKKEHSSH